MITIKILKFLAPENITVTSLKFDKSGFSIE